MRIRKGKVCGRTFKTYQVQNKRKFKEYFQIIVRLSQFGKFA